MEKELFTVRCYGKAELALLYFPMLQKESAVKKLRRWIHKCTPLYKELSEAYHMPAMNSFTAKEVKLIIKHLGEPY